MTTKKGLDPYLLAYLLLTDVVQDQIRSLTSGTSASHNRIRTSELGSVMVPLPRDRTRVAVRLKAIAKDYRAALIALSEATTRVSAMRCAEGDLFSSR